MKTKEIGYLTYFGQFGGNIGIKTKGRVTDQASNVLSLNQESTLTDLDLDDGIQPLKVAINVGAGAEYNLSGSTSVFFGISYNHGFSNSLKKLIIT